MLKLFQSIFGGGEKPGRYPESLIEAATERALEGTDPRLRILSGYRKHLREPIVHAIDHVIALVDRMPTPVPAGRREHGAEPRLAALFASAKDMLNILSRDAALADFRSGPEGSGTERVTALLLAERRERNILGMDLVGNKVRRDVPQVAVSFAAHRLLDPSTGEEEMRRRLKRRAFDHLLSLALARITERRVERDDLARQRDLLRRKLTALEHGGWGFDPPPGEPADQRTLQAELEAVTEQLDTLDAGSDVLGAHLGIVTEVLGDAEHQLWGEDIDLYLDAMNIQRPAKSPSARRIHLRELHNARGRRVVALPISVHPGSCHCKRISSRLRSAICIEATRFDDDAAGESLDQLALADGLRLFDEYRLAGNRYWYHRTLGARPASSIKRHQHAQRRHLG